MENETNVIRLPHPKARACPNCGFLVDQKNVELAVDDFSCPRCEGPKLSEFVQVDVFA